MADLYIYLLAILFNCLISWIAGRWFYSRFPEDKRQARVWQWLGTTLTFFMPVFGLVGLFLVYYLLKRNPNFTQESIKVNFDEHMQKDGLSGAVDEPGSRNPSWRDVNEIQPMVDALTDRDDIELQKGAIDALAAKRDILSIKTLISSMDHAVLEVQYFTVEALTKISNQFIEKIRTARSLLSQEPDSAENLINLADCYHEYADSYIVDQTLNKLYLEQAANLYSDALTQNDGDITLLIKYGHVLKSLGRFQEASDIYTKVNANEIKNTDALINLMEIYFQLGKYSELRAAARMLKESAEPIPEELQKAISVWI